jgi:hypothetical protein
MTTFLISLLGLVSLVVLVLSLFKGVLLSFVGLFPFLFGFG